MRRILLVLIVTAGIAFAVARWLLVDDEPRPAQPSAPAAVARNGTSPATDATASAGSATPSFRVPMPVSPPSPESDSVSPVDEGPAVPAPAAAPLAAQPAAPAVPPVAAPAGGRGTVPGIVSAEPLPPEAAGGSERGGEEKDRGWVSMRGMYVYNLPPQAGGGRGQVNVATTIDCNSGSGVLYYRDPQQRVEWMSSALAFEANIVCSGGGQALQTIANTFNAVFSGSYLPQRADAPAAAAPGGQFGVRFVSTDAAGKPLPFVEFCLALQGGPYGEYALPENASRRAPAPGCVLLDNFWVKRLNRDEPR